MLPSTCTYMYAYDNYAGAGVSICIPQIDAFGKCSVCACAQDLVHFSKPK